MIFVSSSFFNNCEQVVRIIYSSHRNATYKKVAQAVLLQHSCHATAARNVKTDVTCSVYGLVSLAFWYRALEKWFCREQVVFILCAKLNLFTCALVCDGQAVLMSS